MSYDFLAQKYAEALYELSSQKSLSEDDLDIFAQNLNTTNKKSFLKKILSEYEKLLAEKESRINAIVYTPKKLDSKNQQLLVEKLSRKGKVEIQEIIDPDLIAGIKIKIGDWFYDYTIKNMLKKLRSKNA